MAENKILSSSTKKIFAQYVSLSMLSMLGQSLFIFADTFFIANGVGPEGIAALNIVLPMINIFTGIGWMMGIGGSTLYAMNKAGNRLTEAQREFKLTLMASTIIGICFSMAAVLFADPVLRFLGADAAIHQMAKDYYLILMAFAVFFILNYVLISFVRNDGLPRLATIALISGGLTNIVLDYLFIFPFAMGLKGAAYATVISPLVSLTIICFNTGPQLKTLIAAQSDWQPVKLGKVLKLGFPSFLNELSQAVVMFSFNQILLQMVGNIGVAAYGIIANMNIIAIALFTGIGQGFQPLVSQYYGAKQGQQLTKTLKYALFTAVLLSLLIIAVGFAFPETIVALFNNTQNKELAQIAIPGLTLYFVSYLFTGINYTAIYYSAATGDARPSLTLSVLRGLILIIPILLGMANLLGLEGVWLTMSAVESITAILSLIVIRLYAQRFKSPQSDLVG